MNGTPYRMQAYDAKVDPVRLLADLTAAIDGMNAAYAAYIPQATAIELQVKQECDSAGVPTIDYPFYLCFGREMHKKQRQEISGESMSLWAAMCIVKWHSRGLTEAVLQAIRTNVFNVVAPVAP
jgi:hypothetical protein